MLLKVDTGLREIDAIVECLFSREHQLLHNVLLNGPHRVSLPSPKEKMRKKKKKRSELRAISKKGKWFPNGSNCDSRTFEMNKIEGRLMVRLRGR